MKITLTNIINIAQKELGHKDSIVLLIIVQLVLLPREAMGDSKDRDWFHCGHVTYFSILHKSITLEPGLGVA